MASLGKTIRKSFEAETISSTLFGIILSTFSTVAPMFMIMGGILALYIILGYNNVLYSERVLFTSSILYIFIFSLLCTSPFNAVISRYMTDKIFEEKYDSILSCFYGGLFVNMLFCCMVGIPFYCYAYFVGGIDLIYVFTCFVAFISLCLTFYSMLYLSITKDYTKISLFFCVGALVIIGTALITVKLLHFSITYGMLFSIAFGMLTIATCECAYIKGYFHNSNRDYFGFINLKEELNALH